MVRTAPGLCEYHSIRLTAAGRALLRSEDTPREYFDRLRAARLLADARQILAHGLPRRRALWWAYTCACDAAAGRLPGNVQAIVELARRAIVDASDDNRQATQVLGHPDLDDHPMVTCLAMAVFFGGGSISAPHLPFVGPKPFVVPRLVSSVVYLASVHSEPAAYLKHLDRYLECGLALAGGADPWENKGASARLEAEDGVFAW
jgi:hypothetical protein